MWTKEGDSNSFETQVLRSTDQTTGEGIILGYNLSDFVKATIEPYHLGESKLGMGHNDRTKMREVKVYLPFDLEFPQLFTET